MSANILSASSGDLQSLFGATLVFQTVVEYLVYIVAIILVTMIATLWIASSRVTLRQSDRRPEESGRPRSSRKWFGRGDDKSSSSGKRRRRRSHRRRNPTLAETGGLPPIRGEAPPTSTETYQS